MNAIDGTNPTHDDEAAGAAAGLPEKHAANYAADLAPVRMISRAMDAQLRKHRLATEALLRRVSS